MKSALLSLCVLAGCGQRLLVGEDRRGMRDAQADDARDAAHDDADVVVSTCFVDPASGLGAERLAALRAAPVDDTIEALYPYDGTVFPRGLAAPRVRVRAASAVDVALIVLESETLRYEACVSADGERFTLPEDLWRAAEHAALRGDGAFTLRVSLGFAGGVGAFVRNLTVSRTAVSGSVFYQVYGGAIGTIGSASVARLPLGGTAEVLPTGLGCAGCHGVGAAGTRIAIEQNGLGASFTWDGAALGPNSAPLTGLPGMEWAALSPDGSVYVAPGAPTDGSVFGPRSLGAGAQRSAGLFRARDGEALGARGLPAGVMMPAFSRDTRRLVFNDFDAGRGHALSIMDFDAQALAFTSNRRIYTSDEAVYPAWPTFLPDGRVLFVEGASSVGAGGAGIALGALEPPASSLHVLELASGARAALERVDGLTEDEVARVYYPTVLFGDLAEHSFVCFDSYRRYMRDERTRALWCCALSAFDPEEPSADVSFPAFYLPGQDESAAGFRPVATLDGL